MACGQMGDKPLLKPMMTELIAIHIHHRPNDLMYNLAKSFLNIYYSAVLWCAQILAYIMA